MLPHPVAVGTFISPGRSLETALQRVERAEALGYESVYTTHIAGRDSLVVLAAYASRTDRIKLGTGVLPIYSRTPVASAQAAATIDELSSGRMVLGLGVAHQVTVENWYGTTIGKPVQEMRDYAKIVRAIFRGEEPPQSERFPTRFRFMGYAARPDLPIYIAALSPAMLRLAGQIGDGVMLWLCNPNYIRDVVVPEVTEGRKRAGKSLEGFDIVAAVPAAVTEDVETARGSLRNDLIPYFSLPFYRAMIERSGFGDEIGTFDEAMQDGDTAAAASAISDRFLEQLAAIGSAADAEASVRRYIEAGATSPCLGGVPKTDLDSTLQALAGLTPSAVTARAR
jgi:alkanesulfonate monooxygenase SsuD/methylene tetrahydromethanopterin reductase-like flavin-dependent oxidoreductase (luciferase family)